ncbi:hemoblobin-interacting domain-containing protein [Candidatus Pristimantibacillus sp. PTI5]|uniref:hemoblobin-interacting domain-containing protein n=1 Tax=Candidatus Pristimantibacillus sp. PTI5 TaxID=3400422 RepID=UPI003B0123BA
MGKCLLGNVVNEDLTTPDGEHTIYIDNVAIREVAAPPLVKADTTGNKIGQPLELSFEDSPDWRSAISQLTVDGVVADCGSSR